MTTITQMRDRCKQASDNVNSSFVSDAEWDNYIGQSYAELYGLVAQVFSGEYFSKVPPYTFTTDGINDHFALPSDFFKLLGLDVLYGAANQYVSLKPFTLAARNQFAGSNQSIPAAGQTVRMFYVPTPPVFDSGNPLTGALVNNGWDQYIVADACIKALAKEESDVSVFEQQKAALVLRLNAEAENRDAGNPTRIVDSRGRGSPMMMYRLDAAYVWLIGQRVIGQPYSEWANPADGWW